MTLIVMFWFFALLLLLCTSQFCCKVDIKCVIKITVNMKLVKFEEGHVFLRWDWRKVWKIKSYFDRRIAQGTEVCRNATLYFILNGCAGNVASYSQIVVKFPSFTQLKLSVLCIQKPATVPYSGPSKSTLHHCNLFHDNPFNTVRVSVVLSVLLVFPSSSSLI
jgi:hypothetical protein